MEQKILKRLEALTLKLEELYRQRGKLISSINDLDHEIGNTTSILFELKSLIDPEEK